MRLPRMRNLSFVVAFTLAQISLASAQDKSIVVASTTSTQDSGLYGFILPLFKQKTGIDVKVIAQGTGQALDTARRGDADVVLVHAREAEEKFIAEGFGVKRYSVMYNDFVIIGPKDDPASIKGSRNAAFALQTIKAKGAPFISRGDNSGTHSAEIKLWKDAGCGNQTLEGRRHRHQKGGWAVVQIDRAGHGCHAQRSSSQRSLCDV